MNISYDNIFVGCSITKGENKYTVIKKNQKSFYASEMPYSEFVDKWNNRMGATFTAFCKAYDIKSYKYTDGFQIEENEFNRKELAESNIKNDYKLESWEKKGISDELEYLKRKKRNPILYQFDCKKKMIRFLGMNGNSFLINIDGDYILYSLNTGECIKISTVYDYNYSSIPWEKLSEFSKEIKTA